MRISPSPPHINGGTLQPLGSAKTAGVGEAAAVGAGVNVAGSVGGTGDGEGVSVSAGAAGDRVAVSVDTGIVAVAVGVAGGRIGAGLVAVGGTGVAVGPAGVSPEGGASVDGVDGNGVGVRVGTVWRWGDCPGAAQRSGPTASPRIIRPSTNSQGTAFFIASS